MNPRAFDDELLKYIESELAAMPGWLDKLPKNDSIDAVEEALKTQEAAYREWLKQNPPGEKGFSDDQCDVLANNWRMTFQAIKKQILEQHEITHEMLRKTAATHDIPKDLRQSCEEPYFDDGGQPLADRDLSKMENEAVAGIIMATVLQEGNDRSRYNVGSGVERWDAIYRDSVDALATLDNARLEAVLDVIKKESKAAYFKLTFSKEFRLNFCNKIDYDLLNVSKIAPDQLNDFATSIMLLTKDQSVEDGAKLAGKILKKLSAKDRQSVMSEVKQLDPSSHEKLMARLETKHAVLSSAKAVLFTRRSKLGKKLHEAKQLHDALKKQKP